MQDQDRRSSSLPRHKRQIIDYQPEISRHPLFRRRGRQDSHICWRCWSSQRVHICSFRSSREEARAVLSLCTYKPWDAVSSNSLIKIFCSLLMLSPLVHALLNGLLKTTGQPTSSTTENYATYSLLGALMHCFLRLPQLVGISSQPSTSLKSESVLYYG